MDTMTIGAFAKFQLDIQEWPFLQKLCLFKYN